MKFFLVLIFCVKFKILCEEELVNFLRCNGRWRKKVEEDGLVMLSGRGDFEFSLEGVQEYKISYFNF